MYFENFNINGAIFMYYFKNRASNQQNPPNRNPWKITTFNDLSKITRGLNVITPNQIKNQWA